MAETCFEYVKGDVAFFSSDELKWINAIMKLKAEHPNEVKIIKAPEYNDGCIYCSLPSDWLKVRPPRAVTDEQRERGRQLAENLKKGRKKGND